MSARNDVIDVIDIVERYLAKHGYDGLYNPDDECGCYVGDLVPCSADFSKCMPGIDKEIESEEHGKCRGIGPKEKGRRQ